MSETVATPGIEQFLNNRRSTELLTSEIKRLREATTITYLGDFDRAAQAKAPSDKPDTAAATPALTAPVGGGEKAATTPEQSVIERGLQGLK
ncbi:hypothetical protein D9M68_911050 [compost metagenome]